MQSSQGAASTDLQIGMDLKAVDLTIEHVGAAYGENVVLDDVSVRVEPGEFFALLGPSGCGKTTLLRLIAGFAPIRSGRILVDGQDISPLQPWKRDVGMVFQSYALWPHMTVASNVAFGLEERRLPKAEIRRRVAAALDFVGLSQMGDRRPLQLAGGQQQRVALAHTIAIEPKLLLLDEPLSNLDAKLRIQVRRELRSLQKRLGLTTIIVTHDQEEANTICDRVAVMHGGKIQQIGTPTEIYENPCNLFVAQFLGTANVVDGQMSSVGDRPVFEIGNDLALPLAGIRPQPGAKLVFRPQHARIGPSDQNFDGSLQGTITEREFLGSVVRYGVRIAGAEIWVDEPFVSEASLYEAGKPVAVAIDLERACWLAP